MWSRAVKILLYVFSMREAAIIGVAKLEGGSTIEIRQESSNDTNITVVVDLNHLRKGTFEVQLLKSPKEGCRKMLERNGREGLEPLGVLVQSSEVDSLVGTKWTMESFEMIELEENIVIPFYGAIGVFTRSCELGEGGLVCSSGDIQECAELKWMKEIDLSDDSHSPMPTNRGSAILITGGSSRSVEVLRENGSYWCSLPDLPDERYDHTQSVLITCGGQQTKTSCLTFTNGQWVTSHQLQDNRYKHSSWMSQHGVVLMGGSGSWNTTEMLSDNGNGGSTPSFTLKYDTL